MFLSIKSAYFNHIMNSNELCDTKDWSNGIEYPGLYCIIIMIIMYNKLSQCKVHCTEKIILLCLSLKWIRLDFSAFFTYVATGLDINTRQLGWTATPASHLGWLTTIFKL